MTNRRKLLAGVAVLSATLAAGGAFAQETIRIGLILPMTGPFASTGRQVEAAVKLYRRAGFCETARPAKAVPGHKGDDVLLMVRAE